MMSFMKSLVMMEFQAAAGPLPGEEQKPFQFRAEVLECGDSSPLLVGGAGAMPTALGGHGGKYPWPRKAVAMAPVSCSKSGDESPHSKNLEE
jgi:hypothetical protein